MNTETGDIYRTEEEIAKALQRKEPLAFVSDRVAKAVTIGLAQMSYDEAKKYHRKRGRIGRRK